MKGRNISRLLLIAVLFAVMLVDVASASPSPAKLYVDPAKIESQPPSGFTIDIRVDKVTNLYAFALTVDFAPYGQVLWVSSVTEGSFLTQGGSTFFMHKISIFRGTVDVVCMLLGAVPGISGSGTLFSITFEIKEAGESPLNLIDSIMLNNNLKPIAHNVFNGHYYGPTANLQMIELVAGRFLKAGDTQIFKSIAKNFDSHKDLCVKTRFNTVREEDGKITSFYAGQTMEDGQVNPQEPPVYCIGPQEELELDYANWMLKGEDVGRYHVLAYAYYTYLEWTWILGAKEKHSWFVVEEG